MEEAKVKHYAYIRTYRARYDCVEYTRVLKDPDRGVKDDGYRITYNKIGKHNAVIPVVEFIPDKWIIKFRKYKS